MKNVKKCQISFLSPLSSVFECSGVHRKYTSKRAELGFGYLPPEAATLHGISGGGLLIIKGRFMGGVLVLSSLLGLLTGSQNQKV